MNCWFCSVREADDSKALTLNLYGEVDSDTTDSGTKVQYNVKPIKVPRCADCKNRHRIAKTGLFFAFIALIAMIGTGLFLFWESYILLGILFGLSAGLFVAFLFIKLYVEKGIQSVKDAKKDYPQVTALLENHYKFGRRPKNHEKETQQKA